jgi:OOP family OmpA-OmpF porin
MAVVLLVTALTFYSALWFKSEKIEDDITARVTDALVEDGVDGIDIDVDGRHVTLAGVVYDEAAETRYLDIADKTYGALGPIDGLTYQVGGGYINAIKSVDGITLRGTVPNEDVRAALVAEAGAATDGAVTDELVLSGPEADWQDEAKFGVSSLAGLTTGALTAAAGTYALSGKAAGDAAEVEAAFAGREGWQSFVSSPDLQAAEIAALQAAIGERDGKLGEASDMLADRDAELDAKRVEIEGLQSQIDGFEGELAERQSALTASGDEIAALKGQVTGLDTELSGLTAALAGSQSEVEGLRGQIAERDDTIGGLETELAALRQTGDADLTSLQQTIRERDATIEELNARETANLGRIEALTGDVSNRDGRVAELEGLVTTRDGRIAELEGLVTTRDGRIAELEGLVTTRDGRVADLEGVVAERDATIAALRGDGGDLSATVARLEGTIGERDATIAALQGEVSERTGLADGLSAEVAALTAARAAQQGELGDLRAAVDERDGIIASLRAASGSTTLAADQCAAEASAVLEGSRINFVTASAEVANASVPLLERLTGIALACVGDDGLTVEIGGHTDAQGTDENNQALSEARAQAVAAFMTERGVPASGLRAVGYGESQPIATNDTAEGRAENRRISFDWQAR